MSMSKQLYHIHKLTPEAQRPSIITAVVKGLYATFKGVDSNLKTSDGLYLHWYDLNLDVHMRLMFQYAHGQDLSAITVTGRNELMLLETDSKELYDYLLPRFTCYHDIEENV